MSGQRISGRAFTPPIPSPPIAGYEGSGLDGWQQIYRSYETDSAGELTAITDFSTDDDVDQCFNPVVSPDGTKILFGAENSTTNKWEIWVVSTTPGSTPTQLVSDASNYVMQPAWAPDSDTFVYAKGASGAITGGAIYKDTVSSPGSPVSLKASSGGSSPFRPLFNHDGTKIAYIFDAASGADLRVMDSDGSNDASLDNTITGYRFDQPTGFSWANTQNLIAYEDGSTTSKLYVIAADGTGQTQINASGDGASADAKLSAMAWPADDSFVVYTANLGNSRYDILRAETDGSGTTALNASHGAYNANYFRDAVVFNSRIWFIETASSIGKLSSMALDGTDYVNNFASNGGSGDQVSAFSAGDGFYFD